jgi:hypothetical protein
MANEKVVYYNNNAYSGDQAATSAQSQTPRNDLDDVYILSDTRVIGQTKPAPESNRRDDEFEAVYYTDLRPVATQSHPVVLIAREEEAQESLLMSLTLFLIYFCIAYMSYLLLIQNNYALNDTVNVANVVGNLFGSALVPPVDPAVSDVNANYSAQTPRDCGVPTHPPDLTQTRRRRIFGGFAANTGAWPWTISISYMGPEGTLKSACGGSLIAERFVITATHCVNRLD